MSDSSPGTSGYYPSPPSSQGYNHPGMSSRRSSTGNYPLSFPSDMRMYSLGVGPGYPVPSRIPVPSGPSIAPIQQQPHPGDVEAFVTSLSNRLSQLQARGEEVRGPPEVDFDEDDEEIYMDGRNRPKTPPDCCAVCATTSTIEWRKGPAGIRSLCNACGLQAVRVAFKQFLNIVLMQFNQAKRVRERRARGFTEPSTMDHMRQELQAIGAERFKILDFQLPNGTTQRLMDTITRTDKARRQLANGARANRRQKAAEQQVAKTLVAMSKGESPGTRGRRKSLLNTARNMAAPYPAPLPGRPLRSMSASQDGGGIGSSLRTFEPHPSLTRGSGTYEPLLNPSFSLPPLISTAPFRPSPAHGISRPASSLGFSRPSSSMAMRVDTRPPSRAAPPAPQAHPQGQKSQLPMFGRPILSTAPPPFRMPMSDIRGGISRPPSPGPSNRPSSRMSFQ